MSCSNNLFNHGKNGLKIFLGRLGGWGGGGGRGDGLHDMLLFHLSKVPEIVLILPTFRQDFHDKI